MPDGLPVLVAVGLAALLLDRALALELHLHRRVSPPSVNDRTELLALSVLVSFLAFIGAAALVQGGLVEPATAAGSPATPLSESTLVVLAVTDALVGGLLGFRLSILRERSRRAAAWSAGTFAAVVGDRRRRDPGGVAAAPARPGDRDPGLLPVGRDPRLAARPAPRSALDLADGPPRRARPGRRRLERRPALGGCPVPARAPGSGPGLARSGACQRPAGARNVRLPTPVVVSEN